MTTRHLIVVARSAEAAAMVLAHRDCRTWGQPRRDRSGLRVWGVWVQDLKLAHALEQVPGVTVLVDAQDTWREQVGWTEPNA